MELDDSLRLATPEGIDVDLVVVGLGTRFVGFLVDVVIQALLLGALGLLTGIGNLGVAVFLVGSFLVLFGYPVLFETFGGGRTPGKRAAGSQVVTLDGRPVTFLASVIRNVLRVIDALPGPFTVGIVAILLSARHQRVGDIAAGTIVVRAVRPPPSGAWPAYAAAAGAERPQGLGPPPPGWLPPQAASWDVSAVTADELGAARSFLERRYQLTPEARVQVGTELATRLWAKVAGVPAHEGPERFLELVVAAKLSR